MHGTAITTTKVNNKYVLNKNNIKCLIGIHIQLTADLQKPESVLEDWNVGQTDCPYSELGIEMCLLRHPFVFTQFLIDLRTTLTNRPRPDVIIPLQLHKMTMNHTEKALRKGSNVHVVDRYTY